MSLAPVAALHLPGSYHDQYLGLQVSGDSELSIVDRTQNAFRFCYFLESRHENAVILAIGDSYSVPPFESCMDINTHSLDSSAVLLNLKTTISPLFDL